MQKKTGARKETVLKICLTKDKLDLWHNNLSQTFVSMQFE